MLRETYCHSQHIFTQFKTIKMKKLLLTIVSMLFCMTVFAQEAKPCLFIGTYVKNKRGICGDYELVQEGVDNYADYVIKRTQFDREHKTQSSITRFIDANQSVIVYQYEREIVGWKCNSNVISAKTGKSIEDCNKQLAKQQAENPKDFTTQPKIIFTWQGKERSLATYTEDFWGLSGKFTSGNTATKSIIIAQLTNNTINKVARVTLKPDNGTETVEYIYPGSTLTKKYDTKKLDIKVNYWDRNVYPNEEVLTDIKNEVRKLIINDNGKIKSKEIIGSIGVRG